MGRYRLPSNRILVAEPHVDGDLLRGLIVESRCAKLPEGESVTFPRDVGHRVDWQTSADGFTLPCIELAPADVWKLVVK